MPRRRRRSGGGEEEEEEEEEEEIPEQTEYILWEFFAAEGACAACLAQEGLHTDRPPKVHQNCKCECEPFFDVCTLVSEDASRSKNGSPYDRPIGSVRPGGKTTVTTTSSDTKKTSGSVGGKVEKGPFSGGSSYEEEEEESIEVEETRTFEHNPELSDGEQKIVDKVQDYTVEKQQVWDCEIAGTIYIDSTDTESVTVSTEQEPME